MIIPLVVTANSFVQGLLQGFLIGGVYALIALGLTLTYGVMKVVNFAHGDFLMVGMFISYWLWALLGVDPLLTIVVSAPLLFILGMAVYKITIRPILKPRPRKVRSVMNPWLSQVSMTLGLSIVLQNLALLAWKGDYRSAVTSWGVGFYEILGIRISTPRLLAFTVCIGLMAVFILFLLRTRVGKGIRATAQNTDASKLVGVSVERMYMYAFGLGLMLLSVPAALLVSILYVFPTVGLRFQLMSVTTVVLGGYGSIRGALLGGIIIGIAESLGVLFIAAQAQFLLPFIIFILILLLKPSGLIGGGRL